MGFMSNNIKIGKAIKIQLKVIYMQYCYLCDIAPGQSAVVCKLLSEGSMRRRLLDIGLINDTTVECVGQSPLGDPKAFLIRGAVIAIRSEDCRNIIIKSAEVSGVGTD